MNRQMARFLKVSEKQFIADMKKLRYDEFEAEKALNSIQIPKRSTKYSAGYDFVTPIRIYLKPGESIVIPTGIRCQMDNGWFLMLAPRSGHGFKYKLQLDNTVGIIDADYYYAENEGHIMIKITNDNRHMQDFEAAKGSKIAQGIFIPYGICIDDDSLAERTGGFGSTGD